MNKQILINSPIGFTGYGIAGYNIVKELINIQYPVHLFPISVQRFGTQFILESEEDNDTFNELLEKQIKEPFDPTGACVRIWHQFDLAERIGRGKYIGFPFFEIDEFNIREKVHLSIPDELVVASQWAKSIIEDNNINIKTSVVPLGVNSELFDYKLCKPKSDADPYVFICMGKWEIRKGYDILAELFNQAFDINDNVQLWILASSHKSCFSEKELNEWHGYYENTKLKDKIKIFPRLQTQKEVASVISQADCGIFMCRAEGWNLDLLEVMTMDKPVITTNYSAHTEYCDSQNAFLVNIDEKEDAYDGKWFHGFGKWAKIGQNQKDQAIEYMRYVYKNNIRNNPKGIETGQKFSWNNTVKTLIQCID